MDDLNRGGTLAWEGAHRDELPDLARGSVSRVLGSSDDFTGSKLNRICKTATEKASTCSSNPTSYSLRQL